MTQITINENFLMINAIHAALDQLCQRVNYLSAILVMITTNNVNNNNRSSAMVKVTIHNKIFVLCVMIATLYLLSLTLHCNQCTMPIAHRAGQRKQRKINVVVGNRPRVLKYQKSKTHRGVNTNNLTPIKINRDKESTVENSEVVYFNAQSVRNKTIIINDLITEDQPELVFITEAWIKNKGDETLVTELTPPTYAILPFPRSSGQDGGGICLIYKERVNPKCEKLTLSNSCECIKVNALNHVFLCIYHPPPSRKNKSTNKEFIENIETLLENCINENSRLIILGDFNLHHDNPNDIYTKAMITLLDQHNMRQHISMTTHKKGHILDWLVTDQNSNMVHNVRVNDKCISDHFIVSFELRHPQKIQIQREITSRNINAINIDNFKSTLLDSLAVPNLDLGLADSINYKLKGALDIHAPLTSRKIRDRPSAPWYTHAVRNAKKQKRTAERKWRKSGLTVDKEIYQAAMKTAKETIINEKRAYFTNKIESCKNTKTLFSIVNELKGNKKLEILPNNIPRYDLPNKFGHFFQNKIDKIRSSIPEVDKHTEHRTENIYNGPKLNSFSQVTSSDVMEIIRSTPPKSCPLDAIPTPLLLQCLDLLLDPITEIINQSLEFGTVPDCYKTALVKPLIKKHDLDQNDLLNYRPVSNLTYFSKILEKIVLKQLRDHLEVNKLLDPFQSAYQNGRSTETALLKITNDILMNCDEGKVTILTLLDQSAAFDLIDHSILIDRLVNLFGITGTALSWIQSYLSNRKQHITIDGIQSDTIPLTIGVPQGSVLGPILYILYTSPISTVMKEHSMDRHSYADDNQLYKSALPANLLTLKFEVESCYLSTKKWMSTNRLKLNDQKTEILVCCSSSRQANLDITSLTLDGHDVTITPKAKNLGVILDSTLNMEFHINNMIRIMNFNLHRIGRIKPYLSMQSLKQLVSALILSRLDYCNSLLVGLPEYKMRKLQKVQNHAARLVLGRCNGLSSNDMLIELHWLPVVARIEYKMAMLCFKALNCKSSPTYLTEMLHIYRPARALRSQDSMQLDVPRTRLKTYGDRAFFRAGPAIWNSLPDDLRCLSCVDKFKKDLKTYLFCKHLLDAV